MPTEEEVHADLRIFGRAYSLLRRGNLKWIRHLASSTSSEALSPGLIPIQRAATVIEFFTLDNLYRRSALKQHPVLFHLFQRIWTLLNPFHIRAVSRRVLRAFTEFLYEKVFGPTPDTVQAQPFALMDVDIDLAKGAKSGLCFSDFYDSLFEAVDNLAKSKLITEYALISKRIIAELESANWLQRLELHSKAHIVNSPEHQYSAWMHPLLTASRPKFLSSPVSPKARLKPMAAIALPRDTQTATKKVRTRKDVFFAQITKLSNTSFKPSSRHRELNLSLGKSFLGSGEMRLTTPRRPNTGVKDVLSPIAKTAKSGKRSGRLPALIEEVVQERGHLRQFSESLFQF